MTLVLVHGVPETAAIWDETLAELGLPDDEVVRLSPPGFGAPVPTDFEPTSDSYRDWLVGELEQLDGLGPIHLVGHDWGGGHAMRAVTVRPDLVRRFATDIAGTADPRYEWHDLAQVWQTPGDGEAFIESTAGTPVEDRAAMLVAAGMSESGARACAENGPEMGPCILGLYRSARQPKMTLWGEQFAELDERPPTLVIAPTDDHFTGGVEMSRRVAEKWDASIVELEGLGHWWMMQDPARGAEVLSAFLAS
ncbi:MAG: alpha/beta hydrolase [Ilumatobacter sp.]|nr:alpha/beta hydrolase [Ilumatobacter sp.]